MGVWILIGVIVIGAIVMLGVFQMMSDSRSGPVIPMVRIGMAFNNLEAEMWAQRLAVAGVGCRVQNLGATGSLGGPYYAPAYSIELWVRAEDEEEARELLGLRE